MRPTNDQDRLLTYGPSSYTYGPNGELASRTRFGQTTEYEYDSLGNLVRVLLPDGRVIRYAIDGHGRRVAKYVDDVQVRGWLYADQLRPIAELDGTGALISRFVYAGRSNVPDSFTRDGDTYRLFADHHRWRDTWCSAVQSLVDGTHHRRHDHGKTTRSTRGNAGMD